MSKSSNISKKIKSIKDDEEPIKTVLYGDAGTGKTTILGTFPKVLHLDIRENGRKVLKKVKGLKSASIDSPQELEDMYWYLKEERHDFETVGIDTCGGAQLLMIEEIMKKKKKKGRAGDWGTMSQQMWGDVAGRMKETILDYRDLDMNVVFICHSRIFKANESEDDEDENISRIAPKVGPAVSPSVVNVLNAAVDIIGETFIGEKYKITKDPKTGKKTETKSVDYYLRIGPNSSYITKVRRPKGDKLPDVLKDPEYSDLIELME